MKPGDLVIINLDLHANESIFGIFFSDSIDYDIWGYLPIVDCTLIWMGDLIPFEKKRLKVVREFDEYR